MNPRRRPGQQPGGRRGAGLAGPNLTIGDYLEAACAYQLDLPRLNQLPDQQRRQEKKRTQIALASRLAQVIADDLARRGVSGAIAGEKHVAGALSRPRVDVVEATEEDGLKLGIEVKTVNEAAGRAMWNRVGDLRSFAVNYHLKFPYAVCGGVISVPDVMPGEPNLPELLRRTELILGRVNRRPDESAAPHRLEAIALVVYQCHGGVTRLHPTIPNASSGLRYEQFVDALVSTYEARFFPKPRGSDMGADSS